MGDWNRLQFLVNFDHITFTSCWFQYCFTQHTTLFYFSWALWLRCFPPSAMTVKMKAFTPLVMQDLQQMRLIMFFKKCFTTDEDSLKPIKLSGSAVCWVGDVAISWLNHSSGCFYTANNSLLCSHSIKLNMVVKLSYGISGCCSRLSKQQMSAQSARILLWCLSTESIGCGGYWTAEEFLRFCFRECASTPNTSVI